MLGLSLVQDVVFAIALQNSQNSDISTRATEHVQKKLPELIKNYVNAENSKKHCSEEGLHDTSPEILHLILTCVFEESTKVDLSSDTKEKFLKSLKRDFPRELVPVVLAPLLYPGDGEGFPKSTELNMAATQMVRIIIFELFYSINLHLLRNILFIGQ